MKKLLFTLLALLCWSIGTVAAETVVIQSDFNSEKLPDGWQFNTYKDYLPHPKIIAVDGGAAFCDAPKPGTSVLMKSLTLVAPDSEFKIVISARGNGNFRVGARCYTADWKWAGTIFLNRQELSGEWKEYEFTYKVPVISGKPQVKRLGFQFEFPQSTEFQVRRVEIMKIK